jgi:hypothetical protein
MDSFGYGFEIIVNCKNNTTYLHDLREFIIITSNLFLRSLAVTN